ncbi:MAG: hypothetical protein IJV45_00005 [Prevotella sp.]|nr:hypothetical protein [Prevotella sp.]
MKKNLRQQLLTLALCAAATSAAAQQQAATLAGLKACTEGEVEFTLPADAVVSGTGALYSANIIFLWDGTDGVKLVFDTADGDVYSLVQQRPIGHPLSGVIYGRYEPGRKDGAALVCNYGTDKTNYYRELQLGTEARALQPLTPTVAQLAEAAAKGLTDYDNAWVKVEGDFMLTDTYKLFDAEGHSINVQRDYLGIDAQGEYAFDFSPAVGKHGYLYAVSEVSHTADGACRMAVTNPDQWFDATGDVVATQTIRLDASPTGYNVYGDEQSSVNVQVVGAHYKAGGLYPLYLPLDVPRAELLSVFGPATRLMMLSNVGSRINDKQAMLYFETQQEYTQTSAWSVYLIQPSQDVDDPLFHNVHIESGSYVMRLNKYAGNVTHGNIYYYNTFNPVTLNTDGSHRILLPDGTVAVPGEGQNVVGAFTAYLDVSQWLSKHPGSELDRIYITIDGREVETAVRSLVQSSILNVQSIYSLSGQRLSAPCKGIVIQGGRKVVR